MKKLIVVFGIVVMGLLGINYFLPSNFEEPAHLMTDEEMIQVCIEEGIPLDE